MENKIEETTIDDLALMIKKGFDCVDDRFKKVDERFNKMDERFDKMDERFNKMESKVDNLDATLKNQYPDKTYLSNKLADLVAEIGARI